MSVIHRLNRGPFSGIVTHNENGPWRGWYSYSWQAGEQAGSCSALGKEQAHAGLYNAMLTYFRNQAPKREPELRLVVDHDADTT